MLPAGLPRVRPLSSDSRLVAMVRDGHDTAFEALYERHHRAILSFCRHLLGDAHEAEDAVQHTFMAAYRELANTAKEINVRPWLFTIARNRCYSILRARREQPTAEFDQLTTEGLSSQVQVREDLRALLKDMSQLPDEQRAALVLSELDALTHAQVADVLGVRPDKVKALVYQARSSLTAAKDARDTPCAEIRQELSVGRGATLRRANLRRHLRECHGCRQFRTQLERQRHGLRALLPVFPSLALKQAVLGVAGVAGAGGAGAAATVGGGAALSGIVTGGGALKLALAALAVSAGTAGTVVVATTGLPIDHLWGAGNETHRALAAAQPHTVGRRTSAVSTAVSPNPRILEAIGGATPAAELRSALDQFTVSAPALLSGGIAQFAQVTAQHSHTLRRSPRAPGSHSARPPRARGTGTATATPTATPTTTTTTAVASAPAASAPAVTPAAAAPTPVVPTPVVPTVTLPALTPTTAAPTTIARIPISPITVTPITSTRATTGPRATTPTSGLHAVSPTSASTAGSPSATSTGAGHRGSSGGNSTHRHGSGNGILGSASGTAASLSLSSTTVTGSAPAPTTTPSATGAHAPGSLPGRTTTSPAPSSSSSTTVHRPRPGTAGPGTPSSAHPSPPAVTLPSHPTIPVASTLTPTATLSSLPAATSHGSSPGHH